MDELLDLFEMDELNLISLRIAKKKVLMLHPDKNKKDTTEYFLYFKNAYEKLCQIYAYIHHETNEANFKEHDIDTSFKEFIEKKGFTASKNPDMYLKHFNEMFENVHLKDNDGHQEWLKSDDGIYDKNDLETSRKKLMNGLVKIDTIESGTFGNYYSDVKEAHLNTIIGLDQDKLFQETPKFNSVEEYQRHRANANMGSISEQDSLRQIADKEELDKRKSIEQSFEWLKKEELMKKRNQTYISKFLLLAK